MGSSGSNGKSDDRGGTAPSQSSEDVPLPPTDNIEPVKPPLLEIVFRADETQEEEAPNRQIAGFALGVALALLVGLVLFLVLSRDG
ncbi:MAG: hypothetical protein AAGC70_17150 [Pseudomonadota bacterium]